MFLKWIRILLIIVILFSYLPVMPIQACVEGDHEGNHKENGKLDCGYIFHCPFVSNIRFSEPLIVLNMERLLSLPTTMVFDDFRFPIFHPPEGKVKETILI